MDWHNKSDLLKKAAIIFGVLLILYLIIHHVTKPKPQVAPAPTVIVQKPKLLEMTEYATQTGNTVAYQSVDLVARVEGYLDAINFTDGSFVKKGQELFVIEPKPYYEQLQAANASVVGEKANFDYAKAEYARQQNMYKQNATSLNNVEIWAAKSAGAKADVDKAEANAVNAAITYSYTHVLAPFDGRIGRHLVDIGNLVGNGKATDLATIEQIDPIYVYFNLNELDLIKLRNAAKEYGLKPEDINKIPVYVAMQNEEGFPHKGTLDFFNTGLTASTGTMELRAILPNKGFPLVPGLFVQVRIPLSKASPKLTIPDTSVQYDQIGAYVLVVTPENLVLLKRVTLGSVDNGNRAITKGLDAQDNVVISGLQNAIPNHKVTPLTQGR